MKRLSDVALRAYPPSFRARYGQELAALVDDLPASSRTTADLILGAIRAWIRSPFPSTQRRLQATVATTWVAWCAGFLVAPAINRALLDPPSAGASGTVRTLLNAASVSFFVGWALVLLGAGPVVLGALIPAVRAHAWAAVRPLLPTVTLGLLEAIGLLWLGSTSAARTAHLSGWLVVETVLWLIGFAVFVCSLGVGPALSVTRLEPRAQVLRIPTLLTVLVALTLTALTGCSLAAAVIAGDATLVSSTVPVAVALSVGCLASLTAVVTSGRGVHALRST
ncbi:MAG: hypothetical protein ACR2KJ_01310 [Jatrophihabitans sp.]